MTTWSQDYDPLHSWPLSTLAAALPVLSLFFVLLVLKARVWAAALAGMLVAVALALGLFGMPAPLVAGACMCLSIPSVRRRPNCGSVSAQWTD